MFIPTETSRPRSNAENETEVSFFNREMYERFKLNPQVLSFPFLDLFKSHRVSDSVGKLNFMLCFVWEGIIPDVELHICVQYTWIQLMAQEMDLYESATASQIQ